MTAEAWAVTALTGMVLALMGLVLKDTRDRLDRGDRRSDRMEDEMAKEQALSTEVRRTGFERLASVEANFQEVIRRLDRLDGRLDRIEGLIRRNGGHA